jgi:hypothetical protein
LLGVLLNALLDFFYFSIVFILFRFLLACFARFFGFFNFNFNFFFALLDFLDFFIVYILFGALPVCLASFYFLYCCVYVV